MSITTIPTSKLLELFVHNLTAIIGDHTTIGNWTVAELATEIDRRLPVPTAPASKQPSTGFTCSCGLMFTSHERAKALQHQLKTGHVFRDPPKPEGT